MRRLAWRFGPAFLILQSVAAALWWLMLLTLPQTVGWFLPPAFPPDTLMLLALPDAALFIGAGFLAGWGLAGRAPWAWPVLVVHAGASAYAMLWCLGLTLLTGGGVAGLALMLPATAGACLLTWLLRPHPRLYSFGAVKGLESRARSQATDAILTLSQIVVVWTVFLVILPFIAYRTETTLGMESLRFPAWVRAVGGLLAIPCAVFNLWLGIHTSLRGRGTPLPFAAMRELVTSGPYAYIRNPMLVTSVATGLLLSLAFGSPLMAALFVVGGFFWNVVLRPWEERDLAARFGAPYAHYRARVGCWIPRTTAYRAPVMAKRKRRR